MEQDTTVLPSGVAGKNGSVDVPGVLLRLDAALNGHDLESLMACFDPDYRSEHPVHPGRKYERLDSVRTQWTKIFAEVRDFRSELLRCTGDAHTLWAEWRWLGTEVDGTPIDIRGVTLFGVKDDRLLTGRIYMEPVGAKKDGNGFVVR